MGKIRTRILGFEGIEEAQKEEQKKRSAEKKTARNKDEEESIETNLDGSREEKQAKTTKSKKAEKETESHPVKARVRGKKHQTALKKVDNSKSYGLEDSLEILKKVKYANFDESVELHINVDETGLKGEVEMPFSTGKSVRVAVVDDALIDRLEKGVIDCDILVAHPSYMAKLAKYAKVLGPRGLMPNPEAGTISPNPEQVVQKFSKGTVRWKSEPKFPLVHLMIGKMSHEPANLAENAKAVLTSVGKAHVQSAFIKTTMSPALQIDLSYIFV